MSIERDKGIVFHEEGTLNAVTRWITSHDEGIAEWLKNARRAYQPDPASVADTDSVAVILKSLQQLDSAGAGSILAWSLVSTYYGSMASKAALKAALPITAGSG